jgi:DNA-directed RNA polymerase II subunit RPB2
VEEQCHSIIAMKSKEQYLQNITAKINYTHCEINPATILGVIASVIPFPDRQPAPRTTYETGMAKQSIGANSMAYRYRMDTNSHVLWYPQKSLVPTKQYNLLKLDDLPSETNCIVAICSYYGWDQEDGIIINQGAIDKGLFKSFYFKTYTDSENKNSNNTLEEYFQKSSDTKSNKLPDDGIVNPGTKIKDGDRIIDKVINTLDKNKNSSIDIHKVESAVVDKVLLTNSDKGQKLCKVQLRITKTPEIGDKFASKYAQKGTCCMILPQEDMPFTHEGITPDIIINPLCIPSRGTIGHLIESLFGKYSCLSGEILDSTAFNCQNDPKVIGDILQSKYNYSYTGKERLINGINGQMMLVDTYIGVNHYHKLKHLVSEKYQSRARGPVTLLTRQPINLRWVKTYVKSITLVVCHTATSSNCGNILIVFYSERVF